MTALRNIVLAAAATAAMVATVTSVARVVACTSVRPLIVPIPVR